MSSFDINLLTAEQNSKDDKHHYIYEKILKKIFTKIKITNKKKKYRMLFEVPNYVFGFSLYNVKTCIIYLILKLRKHKFIVKYSNPNIILIYWEHLITSIKLPQKQSISSYKRIVNDTSSNLKKIKKIYSQQNDEFIKNFEISKNAPTDNKYNQQFSELDNLNNFYMR